AKKELTGTPVFSRMLRHAAEAMDRAGKRLRELGNKPPDVKTLPDKEAQREQTLALRRLEQVLEVVKAEAERPAGGGGGGGGGGGPEDTGLPPLAQLKLLRKLQQDVNERTEVFKREHPDLKQLVDKDKLELDSIRKEQRDVADLLEELLKSVDEPAEPERAP